jgi:hypothetical protein
MVAVCHGLFPQPTNAVGFPHLSPFPRDPVANNQKRVEKTYRLNTDVYGRLESTMDTNP